MAYIEWNKGRVIDPYSNDPIVAPIVVGATDRFFPVLCTETDELTDVKGNVVNGDGWVTVHSLPIDLARAALVPIPAVNRIVVLNKGQDFVQRIFKKGGGLKRINSVTRHSVIPIGSSIHFSSLTLGLLREGLRFRAAFMGEENVDVADLDLSDEKISEFLQQNFSLMLAGLADIVLQLSKSNLLAISSSAGGFIDALDRMIQLRLPLIPRRIEAFSNSLAQDIGIFLSLGGIIGGGWGNLEVAHKTIFFKVKGEKSRMPEIGYRPRILE